MHFQLCPRHLRADAGAAGGVRAHGTPTRGARRRGPRDRRRPAGGGSAYGHDGGAAVRLAGEVSHLLALLPRRPAPDPAGVAHWILARRRGGAGTLYEGVRRLRAGSLLTLSARDGARSRRYWAPSYREPRELGEPERSGALGGAIERAVERRLAKAAPTAVLLSGGLDSATVAAAAARRAPGEVY